MWRRAPGRGPRLDVRFGPDHLASHVFEEVDDDGTTRLVLCMESDADWWCAIDPASVMDTDLAAAFAAWIERERPTVRLSIDGPLVPAEWRLALARRGFEATGDPWAQLWLPLWTGSGPRSMASFRPRTRRTSLTASSSSERHSRRSTFTVERWHLMARRAGIRSAIRPAGARDDDGAPGCRDILVCRQQGSAPGWNRWEPTRPPAQGTWPAVDRGRGCDLLARAGASGISVTTPMSNDAAVGLYRAAGFRLVAPRCDGASGRKQPDSVSHDRNRVFAGHRPIGVRATRRRCATVLLAGRECMP